jgi:hypothetical protein
MKFFSNNVCSYFDADWTGSYDERSIIGFYIFVDENLVTWWSNKQNFVVQSSVEMKYRAMTSTTSELVWIKQHFEDLRIKVETPMKIYSDNQAARYIA